MGSGYNTSLAAGRAARNKASTRTPVHFWLDVPYYVYELPCKDGVTGEHHTFRSRTPATSQGGMYYFWCSRCRDYREVRAITHQPINRPHTTDEIVALEQDKGTLRERIARALQARGFLNTDAEIASAAAEHGVPVAEIKKINIALVAPEGLSDLPEVCRAGLHEMSPNNLKAIGPRRTCLACYRESDRKAKERSRQRGRAA